MKFLIIFYLLLLLDLFSQTDYVISGELKQWHGIKITFNGPFTSENSSENPFTDYRLNVRFTHVDTSYLVPGYYAADGNASETGAVSGNKWKVIFTPDRTGEWTFTASFRKGNLVAVDSSLLAGQPDAFDGVKGIFYVTGSDKSLPDFRSQGMLLYNGKRYLQFTGSKRYFIKGGSNSPENFLAYYEFDQTPPKHKYETHINDWRIGDPLWQNGKGSSIIGAVNYLSSKGVNSLYMLTFNVNGDGNDVWPYINNKERFRFDCSKLEQWDIVFSHMQTKGILCHFVTQETENDHDLDKGNLGVERKLYYRELIARFGYHPAVIWNLGEEITNGTAQIKSFAEYIKQTDPYKHIVTMHNINYEKFVPLMAFPYLDGPSMYIYDINNVNKDTKEYIKGSADAGKQWVCFLDEIGPYDKATPPDNVDFWHNDIREKALWGHLMAGGGGLEWYMGYDYSNNDLTLEDFRSRDHLWDLTNYAVKFFNEYLPFAEMNVSDSLVNPGDYCISKENEIYAVYLQDGGNAFIDLPDTGIYQIKWFDPRSGGELQNGSKTAIRGNGRQFIGYPPSEGNLDWAVVLTKSSPGTKVDSQKLDYSTLQNFPNPFNQFTNIKYNLLQTVEIKVSVYDILSNLVGVIYNGTQSAGEHNLQWNAQSVPSGIYFIRLETKDFTKSIKCILLK